MLPNELEYIYLTHHKRLFSFIRKRVPTLIVAEDILQDVFYKVLTRIDTLNDDVKIKSWLFTIARNSIIDYYRKDKSEAKIPEDVVYANDHPREDAYKRLQQNVLCMIQRLPLKYRRVLYLADYKGLAYKKIARKLNVSLACVKSKILRARKNMKDIYLGCCDFEFGRDNKVIDYHQR